MMGFYVLMSDHSSCFSIHVVGEKASERGNLHLLPFPVAVL
jgi:hypothetical protein